LELDRLIEATKVNDMLGAKIEEYANAVDKLEIGKSFDEQYKIVQALSEEIKELESQYEQVMNSRSVGRPKIGVTKKVSITLPQKEWNIIDDLVHNGHFKSISEYFRELYKEDVQK
jgi:archaellum component FlaC